MMVAGKRHLFNLTISEKCCIHEFHFSNEYVNINEYY